MQAKSLGEQTLNTLQLCFENTPKGEEAYQRSRQNIEFISQVMDYLSGEETEPFKRNPSKVRDAAFDRLNKPTSNIPPGNN